MNIWVQRLEPGKLKKEIKNPQKKDLYRGVRVLQWLTSFYDDASAQQTEDKSA